MEDAARSEDRLHAVAVFFHGGVRRRALAVSSRTDTLRPAQSSAAHTSPPSPPRASGARPWRSAEPRRSSTFLFQSLDNARSPAPLHQLAWASSKRTFWASLPDVCVKAPPFFPAEIILLCVRWYYGPRSSSRRLDETYVRVGDKWKYVFGAFKQGRLLEPGVIGEVRSSTNSSISPPNPCCGVQPDSARLPLTQRASACFVNSAARRLGPGARASRGSPGRFPGSNRRPDCRGPSAPARQFGGPP